MCVIIGLAKDQQVPFAKLKNAALNNPHGFGLVSVANGKLSVYHKYDEKGNDPEVVAKELDRRAGADMRYLHLRYRTRGSSSKENTHPFTVFNRDGHRIEFMHNGTLGNAKYVKSLQDEPVKSDSRQFAENFLTPVLSSWHGKNGFGDIEDILLEDYLESFFSWTNRGLLISNRLEPMFLGKWETIEDVDKNKIIVSNTDYFGSVTNSRLTDHYKPKMSDLPAMRSQGNFFTKGDEEAYPLGTAGQRPVSTGPAPTTTDTAPPAIGTEKVTKKQHLERDITELKDVDLKKTGRFLNFTDLNPLFDTNGAPLDDELISLIANVTLAEFRGYVASNPEGAARLLEHMFLRCEDLISDNDVLIEKNQRASQMIASLKNGSCNVHTN